MVLVFLQGIPIFSEERFFVGIEPGYLREEWYDSSEFDVNACPVVLEYRFLERFSVKLRCHYYIRNGGASSGEPTLKGAGISLPYYVSSDPDLSIPNGFYVAPYVSHAYNHLTKGSHNTFALESGYLIRFGKYGINLSVQGGATTISKQPKVLFRLFDKPCYFEQETKTGSHGGFYFSFGVWL